MNLPYATVHDMEMLWRPLDKAEKCRAEALLEAVSDRLRVEAENRGYDLDRLVAGSEAKVSVAKSITIDIAARVLMSSTTGDPMTQTSQSAGGYTISGSFLSPGGGIYIKQKELAALGILRQRRRAVDIYGVDDPRDCC